MKKKCMIITLIIILIILIITIYVYKEANYDENEFKLSIKTLLRQELTLDEMKSSNLYKAYEKINSSSNLDEIKSIIKKKNGKNVMLFQTWDFIYGNMWIGYNEYLEPRLWCKLVSFYTPYTIELNDNELNSLFECKSLDDVVDILREPILKLEEFEENNINYIYEWGIKAKYFEPSTYGGPLNFPLPYKQKFRVNVEVIEGNLIHKLSIKKY